MFWCFNLSIKFVLVEYLKSIFLKTKSYYEKNLTPVFNLFFHIENLFSFRQFTNSLYNATNIYFHFYNKQQFIWTIASNFSILQKSKGVTVN